MAPQIIDNKNIKLSNVLKEKLSKSKKARFAVGWLFLSGFKELRNEIDKLDKLEILAGSKTNRETAELMLLNKKLERAVRDSLEKNRHLPEDKRQKILEEEYKELLNEPSFIGATKENKEFLEWLLKKIKERKIEIRIYYKEPLHAKLYLFDYEDPKEKKGEAIIGSSNFSISGFDLNAELNVNLTDEENYEFLDKWFEEKWEESEIMDFTALAAQAIERSWPFNQDITPFRVYLRTLHEIFAFAEEKPKIEIEAELYQYQKDAVIDAYQRLEKYNGVFLSDVPGLGKTYIGAALLAHLESEGKSAIAIVPKRLVDYWEETLRGFGAIKTKVFSNGLLNKILDNEELLKRPVVLVDESHHFRNPDTRGYNDLAKICEGKQVILISATPENLNIWDIYWQLKLFTPYEANHNFRIYPIKLKEYFKNCEQNKSDIDDLISQILIRRTRSDIKEYYPQEKIIFPKRKGPFRIDYSIDDVYEESVYKKIQDLISKLTYARYNIGRYAIETEFDSEEFHKIQQSWFNLQQLVKTNLFRRLESSVKAFLDTAMTQVKNHDNFYRILKEKNKIWIGDIDKLTEISDQIDSGEEIEWVEEENFYDKKKFKVAQLERDIENDQHIFEELVNLIKGITPKDDDKLQTLIKILQQDPIKNKKVIIFTCFESTAGYLYENLKNEFEKVDIVTGKEKIMEKIKRFAPKANKAKINPEDEINILVSTEILSEGLNLQDGQVVINYELHWNPVRIIQRIGRIDRVGSEHDEIFVYNFFPEEKAEKQIKVEDRVKKRIDAIIETFGYDEKTISLDEQIIKKKLFEIYTENPDSIEEVETRSTVETFELEFNKLIKEFPDEYTKALELPMMVNCGKKHLEKGVVVFCRADDYCRLRLANQNGEIISKNDWEILNYLKCKKEEEKLEFNEKNLPIIERVKEDFEQEANKREQDKTTIIMLDHTKQEFIKLLEGLKRGESKAFKERCQQLEEFVQNKHLNYAQNKKLRELTRDYKRKFGLKKEEIINALEQEVLSLLKNAPAEIIPEVQYRYAQVIIAEELK
ncbi:MAG: helicase-related protein [Candidatus Pacebacteria bacterium]|nr:helicase-related protein [Candidatus Paceibacterota bacterium]